MTNNAPRGSDRPIVLVEKDPFLNLVPVILDPDAPAEMVAAFNDFMRHDEPDFPARCDRLRATLGSLYPARVEIAADTDEFLAKLPNADIAVVESERVGTAELAIAPRLRVVQKYGSILRNIDQAACKERGIQVLTVRRRANLACAELIFALMLSLARKLHIYANQISKEALQAKGHAYRPFDRRYTPGANYGRIEGLRPLNGTTIGIIGLGEIGREVAIRAHAFDMKVYYTQRTRLPETIEREYHATYLPFDELMAACDWIVPQVPGTPETHGMIDARRLALMKRGACIVNVSRPQLLVREAIIDALRSGQLGGLGLDPPYEVPGQPDDEMLQFDNVVITPHFGGSPRRNGLMDFDEMLTGMARAWAET
jgi:phosphoglycerate dehydrogenase-like enzyme